MPKASPLFTYYNFIKHRLRSRKLSVEDLTSKSYSPSFHDLQGYPDLEDRRHQLRNLSDHDNPYKMAASKIRRLSSSSPSRSTFARFLTELITISGSQCVLETGTSVGLTTAYLARSRARVISIEKNEHLLEVARDTCKGLASIEFVQGDVNDKFEELLSSHNPDFVFLDADHRSEVVISQVDKLLALPSPPKVIILHDIYWSKDMQDAWQHLISLERIRLAVDLFEAGILLPGSTHRTKIMTRYL